MSYDSQKISKFPLFPGVYLMKGARSKILYIGKAKNLRLRVRQYFSGQDTRLMIPHLLKEVQDIEVIVVTSEKEALLLENTLIKQHKPKYNACLKDDKTYISLKVNHKHQWPMLKVVRYKGRPKSDGLYFGPYSSAHAARETLDLLNRLFPLRECSDRELQSRQRPCILFDMKRCCAPCVAKVSHQDYMRDVQRAIDFLKGKDREILEDLHRDMEAASEALEFERAATLLRSIRALEKTVERQRVAQALGKDSDVIGLFRQGDEVVLTQMLFRGGKLVGSENYDFTGLVQDDTAVLESFLLQHYDCPERLPDEILLPIKPEDVEVIEEILRAIAGRKLELLVPQRGDKLALTKMAQANAKVTFQTRKDQSHLIEKRLMELEECCNLSHFPTRIECFDTSNISGSDPVAALVAFTEGVPDKQRYRKFRIRDVEQSDDYAYMREVLTRRLAKGKEANDLPDLIVVDGGKGHLNVALRVAQELDVSTVEFIGLAKEEGRHDKGMTAEQIFLPERKDPILLGKHSPVLFLLQQIRDEAHRVAISYHRQRRSKRTIASELDGIPGIGPAKRRALLKHFGSVKRIAAATEQELCAVPGIAKAQAAVIMQYFKSPQT